MNAERLALFLMLGQTASKAVENIPHVVPDQALKLSDSMDLALLSPEEVRLAIDTSEPYKLFFVFERYLRGVVVDTLSREGQEDWFSKVTPDIQREVTELEEKDETKQWMSLGSRDKAALLTYPQLIAIMDEKTNWKTYFEDLLRDKSLLQEARWIQHIRNAVCHMSTIPEEELHRVRQVMRDWFRVLPP
jgi:hypothetical protein